MISAIRKDWRSISASFISGALFSFPLSWFACSFAQDEFAKPIPNALLGITVSFLVYSLVFSLISRQTFHSVVSALALKTGIEVLLRGIIHVSLMIATVPAAIASPIAQVLAGFIGHLSVPFLLSRSKTVQR